MEKTTIAPVKTILGLPLNIIWGYIAIIFFMTGDGFELAFLSHYVTSLGHSATQSSFIFTVYGLVAALAAWSSGVVAEIFTPQRTMRYGFLGWIVFHISFLYFGLKLNNYYCMVLFYGLRGMAYPLFLYSFVVVIVNNVNERQVSSALGWFWTVYSIGIGVLGAYIPSYTIPLVGEYLTLWGSLAFIVLGGLIAMFKLKHIRVTDTSHLSTKEKISELSQAVLLLKKPQICYAALIRIINTLSLFGFAVIMPLMFVDELNFTTSEWLQIWSAFFFTTVFSNVFWGIMGEIIGWMTVVRWCGCMGMAFSSLLFYYMPQYFGHNFYLALIPAIVMGFFIGCFVSVTAMMTTLEPNHKGAAVSVYNLSAGLSNFVAPALAVIFLPIGGVKLVVLVYTALYLFAFVLTFMLTVKQEGFNHHLILGAVKEKSQEAKAYNKEAIIN